MLAFIRNNHIFDAISRLVVGRLFATAVGLLCFVIVARSLGVEQFGFYALITSYVLFVDKFLNFQSWQVVVRFCAEAQAQGDKEAFSRYFFAGLGLDVFTAVLAAVLAWVFLPWVAPWFGLPQEIAVEGRWYVWSIVLVLEGAFIAYLRLMGRYGLQAIQQSAMSLVRLLGLLLVAYFGELSVITVLMIDAGAKLFAMSFLVTNVWRINRSKENLAWVSFLSLFELPKGFWTFCFQTNLTGSVKASVREVDVLIVGGLLGPVSAGLFRVIKRFGSVFSQLGTPVIQVLYPEFSKMIARKEWFTLVANIRRVTIVSIVIAGSVWGGYLVVAPFLITSIFGEGYKATYWPGAWYLLGLVVAFSSSTLQPTLQGLGDAFTPLKIYMLCGALYLGALTILVMYWGLLGAGIAHVLYFGCWASLMYLALRSKMSKA